VGWWTYGSAESNGASQNTSSDIHAKPFGASRGAPGRRTIPASDLAVKTGTVSESVVGPLLDVLGRMEVWLAHQSRTGLTPEDRVILAPASKDWRGMPDPWRR
jgi:hypothetical protein